MSDRVDELEQLVRNIQQLLSSTDVPQSTACCAVMMLIDEAGVEKQTTEEQRVAERAVEHYRAENARKRSVLQDAATQFFHAASFLQQVWQNCGDYTGDAFEGYPSNWPSFDELVVAAGELRVRADYEFGETS